MTRALMICGSTRGGSFNARLLDVMAGALPDSVTQDRLEARDVPLPLWSAQAEHDPVTLDHLRKLHSRFAKADALIIASPEFNASFTPYLKNLIDWTSRLPRLDASAPNAFLDKPVLMLSASPGWSGGAMGLLALRGVLAYVGAIPFGETICLPYADQAWLADGALNPDFIGTHWRDCLARFASLVVRQQGSHP